MRKYDIFSGLFLLAVAVAICVGSLQLHVGSLTEPGAGFFPLVTGLALGVFSIAILTQAPRSGGERVRFWAPEADKKGLLLAFLFILVYALLLERVGFIGTTIFFFVLMSRFVSRHRWTTAIFFALVTSFATYFVFDFLLRAPLPPGILGRMF